MWFNACVLQNTGLQHLIRYLFLFCCCFFPLSDSTFFTSKFITWCCCLTAFLTNLVLCYAVYGFFFQPRPNTSHDQLGNKAINAKKRWNIQQWMRDDEIFMEKKFRLSWRFQYIMNIQSWRVYDGFGCKNSWASFLVSKS